MARHDTLTVLGTPFHDVREYRHALPDGQSWTAYFVRGLGHVALVWPGAEQQSRLVRATVGGTTFTAATIEAPRSGVTTQPLTAAHVEQLALLGTVWAFVVTEPTPFARFATGDSRNPGAFRWTPPIQLQPVAPHYDRPVVVLVGESSVSQAEYTAMALRAGANTTVVGSTTAAADGNVSMIRPPGGLETLITGIGVFYPDRTPTQRIGIIPDLEVRPSIAGIRAGRDGAGGRRQPRARTDLARAQRRLRAGAAHSE